MYLDTRWRQTCGYNGHQCLGVAVQRLVPVPPHVTDTCSKKPKINKKQSPCQQAIVYSFVFNEINSYNNTAKGLDQQAIFFWGGGGVKGTRQETL